MAALLQEVFAEKASVIGDVFLDVYKQIPAQRSFSLLGGRGGSILVQYLYYRHTGNPAYRAEIEKNIEFIIETIETADDPIPTFCDGLAGTGWLLMFLNRNGMIEMDDDTFLEELDELLLEGLHNFIEKQHYDLLHGALGICLYFLKRGRYEVVAPVVMKLYEAGKGKHAGEYSWQRYDPHYRHTDVYDLGLAHGQAGILYFLGKCYQHGVLPEICREMITGNYQFFLNNMQDHDTVGSFFPDSIIVSQYNINAKVPNKSRLAWCYGDLGILHTLLLTATWLKASDYIQQFEQMMLKAASRRSLDDAKVWDAQFCHGGCGNGYMFLSAGRLTGNPVFRETAAHWLEQCMQMGNKDSITAGYLFFMGEHGWHPAVDLLSGVGGLAALLLAYDNDQLPHEWDECLFLS